MACLSFLKNIIPGISNTLICKVLNIRLELSEGFLVLRVKDNTKTNILFRKFQLSCVKQEIIDNSVQIDVWQTSSHQVDILVKCTADGVVPYLKEGATVCLNGVECRAVPLGSTNVVHELYLNNESGNKLRVIPCDDFKFSVQERLDNALYIDGRAFLGTIELIKIRNGLCFYLLCEVMKVSREESTGHMVMRVRDATKIRIATKKYDVDNHSQSDKEESFDINSNAVDILVTSPPQNLSDLTNKILKLGIVRCDKVSCNNPDLRYMHVLSVDASQSSLWELSESLRCVETLRSKLNTERLPKKKRAKKN